MLAEGLTCDDVRHVEAWMELLAGRGLQHNGSKRLPGVMLEAHQKDAVALRTLIDEVKAAGRKLEPVQGPTGAALRAEAPAAPVSIE